jgi:hypothetical protein
MIQTIDHNNDYMTVYDYIMKEGKRSVPLYYLKMNISVSVF